MSISLLEKLAGKTEEKEVEYNGVKIVFRTLSQKDYDDILYMNPISNNNISQIMLNKVPILARALVSIDGVRIEQMEEYLALDEKLSDIAKKERILGSMDALVIDNLIELYVTMREDILKKKTKQNMMNFSNQ